MIARRGNVTRHWLVAVAIVCLLCVAVADLLRQSHWKAIHDPNDFVTLYAGAVCMTHACNPYSVPALDSVLTGKRGDGLRQQWADQLPIYPPTTLFLLLPFSRLSYSAATALWYTLSLVAYLGALAWVWLVCAPRWGVPLWTRVLVLALGVHFPKMAQCIGFGNPSLIVTGLLLFALLDLSPQRRWLRFVAATLACLLKPPLALPLTLLLIAREFHTRRRALAAAAILAGSFGAFLAAAFAIPGMSAWRSTLAANLALGERTGMNPAVRNASSNVILNLANLPGYFTHNETAIRIIAYAAFAALALLSLFFIVPLLPAIRREGTTESLLAVAATAVLTLLPVYHRFCDAGILLLAAPWVAAQLTRRFTIPACAALLLLLSLYVEWERRLHPQTFPGALRSIVQFAYFRGDATAVALLACVVVAALGLAARQRTPGLVRMSDLRPQTAATRPAPAAWKGSLACALLVGAALAIAHPVAEMGFIDDFAYIRMAQLYATTGHFFFNGWESAMLGWLVVWGALFIKLLGFSFTHARLSMMPLAMLSAGLFHASLRRFGIAPRDAITGTLTLALSPLFLPLAASFMSDLPGLFVILLTLYLCQRALAGGTSRTVLLWLVAATAANLFGGTVRQTCWLGALVMVPCTAVLLRRRRAVLAFAAALWVASLLFIFFSLHWFLRQRYILPEHIYEGPLAAGTLAHMGAELLKTFLCLLLTLLPLSIAFLPGVVSLGRAAIVRLSLATVACIAAAFFIARHGGLQHRVMPWIGHIIGTQSIFPSSGEMLGDRVTTLPMSARLGISLLVILAALAVLETAFAPTRPRRFWSTGGPLQALLLLGPFSLAYALSLVPRATYAFVYDRYLLGLMPGGIVLLLLLYRRWSGHILPALAPLCVAMFAAYTIAGTHDWFALNRARASAVATIHATGVPYTAIQGGFDYDGWTQVVAQGYINDQRITFPANAYSALAPSALDSRCVLHFAQFTPAIQPRYFVVFSPMDCLAPSRFASITYENWLPPHRRTIFIQQLPPPAS